jgi:hypothetical protein
MAVVSLVELRSFFSLPHPINAMYAEGEEGGMSVRRKKDARRSEWKTERMLHIVPCEQERPSGPPMDTKASAPSSGCERGAEEMARMNDDVSVYEVWANFGEVLSLAPKACISLSVHLGGRPPTENESLERIGGKGASSLGAGCFAITSWAEILV